MTFRFIVIAMLIGIAFGAFIHANLLPDNVSSVASYLRIITDIFLRLIKMIIAPLVLTTLVVGIAHMGDSKTLGRVGTRTIGWFIGASMFSLTFGLIMVNLLHPGAGFDLDVAPKVGGAVSAEAFSLAGFTTHLVPRSIFEAMATNKILQIVVFSVFAGIALARLAARQHASPSFSNKARSLYYA